MLIKDIMTKDVITVSPVTSVHKLAELFVEKNITGAPVVDDYGKLLGIANEEDIVYQDKKIDPQTFVDLTMGVLTFRMDRYEEEIKKIKANKVLDIMKKDILTVSPGMTVEDVATMMIEKQIYYFPVVEDNKLVGVVTKRDIVRSIAKT